MSKPLSERTTIWNATASTVVPVLDALDMTVPFTGLAAARARFERSKTKSERIQRAFMATPDLSLRKRVK